MALYRSGIGVPALKRVPLTPTAALDDFNLDTLDGAWSAQSHQGSFATTDCMTQARNGSKLRMMFAAKNGLLYRTKSNVDLDLRAGAMRGYGQCCVAQNMWGIAALNSVGTGVAVISYNDGNAYMGNITTYGWASTLQTFSLLGHNYYSSSEYWFRLVRTTNSWVAYVSLGGGGWGTASAASSVTITVDRVAVGMFYNTASAINGALEVDWIDV